MSTIWAGGEFPNTPLSMDPMGDCLLNGSVDTMSSDWGDNPSIPNGLAGLPGRGPQMGERETLGSGASRALIGN